MNNLNLKQYLLCAFIIPSLPKAFGGLKDLNDHCLLKAAELKTSSAISVFLVCITCAPVGSLGCLPAGELALLSAGSMYCFDACQLAMRENGREKRRFSRFLFVCLFCTWLSISSLSISLCYLHLSDSERLLFASNMDVFHIFFFHDNQGYMKMKTQ